MTAGPPSVWILRIVQQDGNAVAGVPVTRLDDQDGAAGYWVSDAAGIVALPADGNPRVRLRVGLRNEQPVELDAATLAAGPVVLSAPRDFPSPLALTSRVGGTPAASAAVTSASRPTGATGGGEALGQVVQFARLITLAPAAPDHPHPELPAGAPASAGDQADFFAPAESYPMALRYGVLAEVEQYWQPLACVSGDLLYSVALPPGDEARVAVVDGRWGEGGGAGSAGGPPRDRPLQALARMIGSGSLSDLVAAGDGGGVTRLDPVTLVTDQAGAAAALARAAADTVQQLNDRATRVADRLRRAPLRVVELGAVAPGDLPAGAALRVLRNPRNDRLLAYHFYEPLQHYRISARAARLRPVVLVPFRLPNLAVRGMVRQFGALIRRALLDPTLLEELDGLLGLGSREGGDWERAGASPPVSELRLIVEPGDKTPAPELGQLWCYLRADAARYTVHFFPASVARGPLRAAPGNPNHWIGAIRLADFHQQPLRYPGELTLENGSRASLIFKRLHLEGRSRDSWRRLLTVDDLVFPAQSQVQLASLSALVGAAGLASQESRLLGHIAANLPYYAAAIIAGGDPGVRWLALARLRDAAGRPLTDLIENSVVGVLGNHLAFPLVDPRPAPAELRNALAEIAARPHRLPESIVVTVPLAGVWLSAQAGPAIEGLAEEPPPPIEERTGERPRGGRRFQA